jgi:hypothetical protein
VVPVPDGSLDIPASCCHCNAAAAAG